MRGRRYNRNSDRDREEERRALNRDGPSSVKTTIPKNILITEAVKHGFRDVWEFIAHYDLVFLVEKDIRGSTTIKFEPKKQKQEEEA